MLAATLWLLYAIPAYVLGPIVFRLRYGFSPVKERFPPRTRYQWVDFGLGVALTLYSIWIALPALWPSAPWAATLQPDEPAHNLLTNAGVALWAAGCLLRIWTVTTLGPNWRIGQDDRDDRAQFVATGPYRFLKHPINAGLILVAAGLCGVTALETGSVLLLAGAVAYYLEQGRAEERFWADRAGQARP